MREKVSLAEQHKDLLQRELVRIGITREPEKDYDRDNTSLNNLTCIEYDFKLKDIEQEKSAKKAFFVERGKKKYKIIEEEAKNYQENDKDTQEEFEENFKTYGPDAGGGLFGDQDGFEMRTIEDQTTIIENSKNESLHTDIIDVEKGEIVEDNSYKDKNKEFPRSEIMFHHCRLVLADLEKDFSDFTLMKIIIGTTWQKHTVEPMMLFFEKEWTNEYKDKKLTFPEKSDGFYAFLGTPLGQGKGFLLAQHPRAFKNRKLTSVTVEPKSTSKGIVMRITCEIGEGLPDHADNLAELSSL